MRRRLTITLASGVLLASATSAHATWPGANGRIAFIRQVPTDAHDSSTIMTAPARGGRARRHWFTRRFISAIDWQPR